MTHSPDYDAIDRGDAILLTAEILARTDASHIRRRTQAARALEVFDLLRGRGSWIYVEEHPEPQDYLFYSFDIDPLDLALHGGEWIGGIFLTHHVAAGTISIHVSIDHPDHDDLEPYLWWVDDLKTVADVVRAAEHYRWGDPYPKAWTDSGRTVEFGDPAYETTFHADELRTAS